MYFINPLKEIRTVIFSDVQEQSIIIDIPEDAEQRQKNLLDGKANSILAKTGQTIKKYGTDFKIYDAGLDIILPVSQVFNKSGSIYEIQQGFKFLQGWKAVPEDQFEFDVEKYLYGNKKEASQFVKGVSGILGLSATAANYLSKIAMSGNPSERMIAISSIFGEAIYPFLRTTVGVPLKLMSSYSSLQAAFEMPEATDEEKNLKKLQLVKCKADLGLAFIKTGLTLGYPTYLSNPMIALPLALSSLGIGLVNAYATYKELRGKKEDSPV